MARRKHYNFLDGDLKTTAVALTEIPEVRAIHVTEAIEIHEGNLTRKAHPLHKSCRK